MRNIHFIIKLRVLTSVLLVLLVAPIVVFIHNAEGLTLSPRTIKVGTSQPSAITSHNYSFNTLATSTVGSIKFEYCINDAFVGTPCVPPSGLNVQNPTLSLQAGIFGFTLHPTSTANTIIITRPPTPVLPTAVGITFNGVTNPSTVNQPVYIRMSIHATTDATGPYSDEGAVVLAITNGVGTNAFVPPFLIFCVAVTVEPNCSSTGGVYVGMGELSSTSPRSGTSQFAGATNDVSGYSVAILGSTMTSGNNVIPALASATNSVPGTGQFGINLRSNSIPSSGSNPTGAGTLFPTAPYNSINQYTFVPGATIASSSISTEFNRMTVSYIANIAQDQPPGVYSTTLTYVATASF